MKSFEVICHMTLPSFPLMSVLLLHLVIVTWLCLVDKDMTYH